MISVLIVTEAGETILAPVISTQAGLVMAEIVPRIAVFAVVFAYRAPLPLAEVGAPLLPRHPFFPRLVETPFFCRLALVSVRTRYHHFLHKVLGRVRPCPGVIRIVDNVRV